jgi:hypothetical protein
MPPEGDTGRAENAKEQPQETKQLPSITTEVKSPHYPGGNLKQAVERAELRRRAAAQLAPQTHSHHAVHPGERRHFPPGAGDKLMGTQDGRSRGCFARRGRRAEHWRRAHHLSPNHGIIGPTGQRLGWPKNPEASRLPSRGYLQRDGCARLSSEKLRRRGAGGDTFLESGKAARALYRGKC